MFRTVYKCYIRHLFTQVHPKATRQNTKMPRLSVRCVAGEERMQMSFSFPLPSGVERQFNMFRLQNESLESTLSRLQANVTAKVAKKKKKKQKQEENDSPEEPMSVSLLHGDTPVDGSLTNIEAWKDGATLLIGENEFDVHVNLPTVNGIFLTNCIMAGYVICPKVDVEFSDLSKCRFVWYRSINDAVNRVNSPDCMEVDSSLNLEENSACSNPKPKKVKLQAPELAWEEVHEGPSYSVSKDDIGRMMKVVCTPSDGTREGQSSEVIAKKEVTTGPDFCPFENRHVYTKKISADGNFRVVTYNILADQYADSDYSRDYLFPYCPTYAMDIDYRKLLIIKELLGYNADVICLQEVDKKVFINDLLPTLEVKGFGGMLKLKAGQVPEGTATFYRKSKFRLQAQHDLDLISALSTDPLYTDLKDKVDSKDGMKEQVYDRTTALQLSVLESLECPGKKLIVATTHLYFHPRCPHVRILQTLICFRHIERILQLYKGDDVSVIYCGDLNATQHAGVHELITKRKISASHADWWAGGKAEHMEGMDLSHNLELHSACGYPPYTNYVSSFSGCLDYIYIDSNKLHTLQVVPLPSHQEVTQATALPNPFFPSDHLALVCDLTWKDNMISN